MARVYSFLAQREIERDDPIAAARPKPEDETAKLLLAAQQALKDERERAEKAEAKAVAESDARVRAEQSGVTEREARIAAEARLGVISARVTELEARPTPEPEVIVRTVSIPTERQSDPEVVGLLKELTANAPKPPKQLVFDVVRDELGRARRIVVVPEAG